MLDDLKYIAEHDSNGALDIVEKQWKQLLYEYENVKLPNKTFHNIVHSGMGGSALWALVAKTWPAFSVPFEIVKDYSIPEYVNKDTLFIASSYSGNTEETLSALKKAEERGATIIIITSGGRLAEIANENNYPHFDLPSTNGPPRYGMFYGLVALCTIAVQLKLTKNVNALGTLKEIAPHIKKAAKAWIPSSPTSDNIAKQLAAELMGKSVVLYSDTVMQAATHKWKIGINENAKNIAFSYQFPEFNHNEFTGWTSHPIDKPYAVIYLSSSFDHERVTRRFDLSTKMLSGRWPSPQTVTAAGSTVIEQVLWTIVLGDFVSIYLALLNGVQPIDKPSDDIIEKFKRELGDYNV